MKGIREIGVVVASTGMVTALLTAYFNWRTSLLRRLRIERSA